jgi:hypothetical protein
MVGNARILSCKVHYNDGAILSEEGVCASRFHLSGGSGRADVAGCSFHGHVARTDSEV